MKIGLATLDAFSHLSQMCLLGKALQRRGHQVVLFGSHLARAVCERESIGYVCLDKGGILPAQLEQSLKRLGGCGLVSGSMQTARIFGLTTCLFLEHLPRQLEREELDGFIIDQVTPAAAVVAERLNIPYAVACIALVQHSDSLLEYGYRNDVLGRILNRAGTTLVRHLHCWLSGHRTTGDDPLMLAFDHQRGVTRIAQQPEFLDRSRSRHEQWYHFTGPWIDTDKDDTLVDFPWDWLDERPLIYASMGTLQNNRPRVFESILRAVSTIDAQIVISMGGRDSSFKTPLPSNVLVVKFAPQLRLLERASLAITHAGMNTVLECLRFGVPMLCLPVTNDQPSIARCVLNLGVGRVVSAFQISKQRLAREINELLQNESYHRTALKFAQTAGKSAGLDHAAELVEAALRRSMPSNLNIDSTQTTHTTVTRRAS